MARFKWFAEALRSVEDLAANANLDSAPDFHKLRKAIGKLQDASLELDDEKIEAEEGFAKALKRLLDWQRKHRACKRSRVADWVKRVFGVGAELGRGHRVAKVHAFFDGLFELVLRAEAGTDLEEFEKKAPIKPFIKAAMRVRKVNQKLIHFERGVSRCAADV
jgi:N-acetylated-alpha-linked acidic dipeptidase